MVTAKLVFLGTMMLNTVLAVRTNVLLTESLNSTDGNILSSSTADPHCCCKQIDFSLADLPFGTDGEFSLFYQEGGHNFREVFRPVIRSPADDVLVASVTPSEGAVATRKIQSSEFTSMCASSDGGDGKFIFDVDRKRQILIMKNCIYKSSFLGDCGFTSSRTVPEVNWCEMPPTASDGYSVYNGMSHYRKTNEQLVILAAPVCRGGR